MSRVPTLCLLALAACAAHPPPSATMPTPPPPVGDPFDDVAQTFFGALQTNDFAKASTHFDAVVKNALPPEKLEALWKGQLAQHGALKGWEIAQRAPTDGKELRVLALHFERGELLGLLAIAPDSHLVAGFFLKPAPTKVTRVAPYVASDTFSTAEVSLGKPPFELGGTLSMPKGPGPFPAVVLVHGSGPHDRDATFGPNAPFKDLAEGLASRGVASLRYDKRTWKHGATIGTEVTLDQEVIDDAIAAVALLRARPEIDRARVFVVGHSLGALLAPEIASRAKAAGAVLLAPPGRPMATIVVEQLRYLEAPATKVAEIEQAFARKQDDERILGAPFRYWREVDSKDAAAAAKALGKPVLVLRGDRDYQVVEADLAKYRVAGLRVETLAADNHLFMPGSGKPSPAEYQVAGHVDPKVVERVTEWVKTGK